MKRIFTLTLLFSLLLIAGAGCSHDPELIDTSLIKGYWELTSNDADAKRHIYHFGTQSEQTQSWGVLTTYVIDPSCRLTLDHIYDWHISDPTNDSPVLLDITEKGGQDIGDGSDIWSGHYRYIVEQLTPSEMTLRLYEVGDTKTRLHLTRLPQ